MAESVSCGESCLFFVSAFLHCPAFSATKAGSVVASGGRGAVSVPHLPPPHPSPLSSTKRHILEYWTALSTLLVQLFGSILFSLDMSPFFEISNPRLCSVFSFLPLLVCVIMLKGVMIQRAGSSLSCVCCLCLLSLPSFLSLLSSLIYELPHSSGLSAY